jgi:peptide/nickel transport system substrate-binding protein
MRRILLLSVSLVTLALTAAWGSSGPSARAAQGAGSQTFTYDDSTQIMVGWDPATDYSEELVAFSNMYEGLTRYDSTTRTVKPLLATSWARANGGKKWTFHLRHGVKFHTGRPFNAAAAKAAILRTQKLGQAASYEWGSVTRIDTPDPYTLVFHCKESSPLDIVSSSLFSAYMYDTKAAGSSSNLANWFAQGHDAGTGPYTVEQWSKGQEIELRLKSVPGYWGGWSGNHYSRVVFRVVPTASTAAALLRSGQVTFVRQLTPQLIASLKSTPGIKIVDSQSFTNMFAMLNTKRPPLDNRSVRQAIAWGINYTGIQTVLKGLVAPGGGIIPPGLLGYTKNLPLYHYDAARAEKLLKAAGYGPGGKSINLTLTYIVDDAVETPTAQLIKSSLAPLNINVKLEALQWPVLWAKTKTSNAAQRQDIALYQWYPDYADPYSWFTNLFMTQKPVLYNATYYSNPSLDTVMHKAYVTTAVNRGAAQKTYESLQKTLLDEVPAIPLGNVVNQFAMRDSFTGFVPNAAYWSTVFVYNLTPK